MEKVTVAKLKNNLSRYLSYVARGGQLLVYRREAPIAVIGPVNGAADVPIAQDAALLRALEREGVVSTGTGVVPEELRTPPAGSPAGVLDALLDERADGR